MTNHDLANLIAFGNRAHMSGQEADTWVDLKHRLVATLDQLDGKPQIAIPGAGELPPGSA